MLSNLSVQSGRSSQTPEKCYLNLIWGWKRQLWLCTGAGALISSHSLPLPGAHGAISLGGCRVFGMGSLSTPEGVLERLNQ